MNTKGLEAMRRVMGMVSALLLIAATAGAQTPPTIPVLGLGEVAFEVPTATLADAQTQTYRAYVDARPAVVLKPVCSGTASPFVCAVPLSAFALTATHSLSLSAAITAADGEQEGPKVAAPFSLKKVGPPVSPPSASIRVRPVS